MLKMNDLECGIKKAYVLNTPAYIPHQHWSKPPEVCSKIKSCAIYKLRNVAVTIDTGRPY